MSDVIAALAAVLAVAVAAFVYWGQRRAGHMEVARSLHVDLTTGEVARARELLGTLRYGTPQAKGAIDPASALTGYFAILWCFERIQAGRVSLMDRTLWGGRPAAVRFLDDLVHWHVVEWQSGLPLVRATLEQLTGSPIDDAQSGAAFARLLREHGTPEPRRGSLGIVNQTRERVTTS